MNRFLIMLIACIVLWDLGWWLAGVKQLAPWSLKRMLKENAAVELLDVRTPMEQRLFRIPGAKSYWDTNLEDLKLSDTPLAIICMSGHRSPPIVLKLSRKLDRSVYNLTGGMLAWLAVLGPVE